MSISAVASSAPATSYQPIQKAARGGVDNDGDEATESAAVKSKESASAPAPKPANSNVGTLLNVTV